MENDFETLKENYSKYISLLRKFYPESAEAVDKLEEAMGDRLFLAPRELVPQSGGVPGGLVSFAVSVAKRCKMFQSDVNPKKLARVALIHELGKLGGLVEGQELYVPEESDWHREKLGRNYKYNDACPKMSGAHRTLFYVSHFGFKVDEEEWVALATSAGFQYDENKFYANEILPLAQSLHAARTFSLAEIKVKR